MRIAEVAITTVWRPELCLHNALFDSLKAKDKAVLNFESIVTTSFQDPIFNNTRQDEWIDHILYNSTPNPNWVTRGKVHDKLNNGTPIWKIKASDHYPISAMLSV